MSERLRDALNLLQIEVRMWSQENFGVKYGSGYRPLLGAVEEIGELCHAQLKGEQGIRGTKEEHEAEAKDAVGDIIIYLADYCGQQGFKLGDAVDETWKKVIKRNWRKNPVNADVPTCASCGSAMLPNGSCWKCPNCGESSGCS